MVKKRRGLRRSGNVGRQGSDRCGGSSDNSQVEFAVPGGASTLQGEVVSLVVVAGELGPVEHGAGGLDAVAQLDALAAIEGADAQEEIHQFLDALLEALGGAVE